MNNLILPGTSKDFLDLIARGERKARQPLDEDMRLFLLLVLLRTLDGNKKDRFVDNLACFLLSSLSAKLPPKDFLRVIGDSALILAGFFPRRANRTCVEASYYVQMGQAAYGRLSHLTRESDWRDASLQFPALVDVLLGTSDEDRLDERTAKSLSQLTYIARRRWEIEVMKHGYH